MFNEIEWQLLSELTLESVWMTRLASHRRFGRPEEDIRRQDKTRKHTHTHSHISTVDTRTERPVADNTNLFFSLLYRRSAVSGSPDRLADGLWFAGRALSVCICVRFDEELTLGLNRVLSSGHWVSDSSASHRISVAHSRAHTQCVVWHVLGSPNGAFGRSGWVLLYAVTLWSPGAHY